MSAFIYYLGAFTFAAGIARATFAVVDRIEGRISR
jgi:hypothetical protein